MIGAINQGFRPIRNILQSLAEIPYPDPQVSSWPLRRHIELDVLYGVTHGAVLWGLLKLDDLFFNLRSLHSANEPLNTVSNLAIFMVDHPEAMIMATVGGYLAKSTIRSLQGGPPH